MHLDSCIIANALVHDRLVPICRQGASNRLEPAVRRRSPVFAARVFDRCCLFDFGVNPKNACNHGNSPSGVYSDSNFAARPRASQTAWTAPIAPFCTRMAHAANGREGRFLPSLCCSCWIEDLSSELADLQLALGVLGFARHPGDRIREPPHAVTCGHVHGIG